MTITLAAHLVDVLLVAAALVYLRQPSSRRLGLVFAAALASQLLYVSSLFTVSTFLLALAFHERRHALKLGLVLAASGALAVLWLYHPFLLAFFGEILPAVLSGARMGGRGGGAAGLGSALFRVPLFFGWALPLLALAGLLLVRARADAAARSTLQAYAAAFALLVGLRAFGGGLFRDLKEIEFVAPLVAIGAGAALEGLAASGRHRAALLVGLGLALFGAGRAVEIVRENLSPFTEIRAD
jgi:hypothetical protein